MFKYACVYGVAGISLGIYPFDFSKKEILTEVDQREYRGHIYITTPERFITSEAVFMVSLVIRGPYSKMVWVTKAERITDADPHVLSLMVNWISDCIEKDCGIKYEPMLQYGFTEIYTQMSDTKYVEIRAMCGVVKDPL